MNDSTSTYINPLNDFGFKSKDDRALKTNNFHLCK